MLSSLSCLLILERVGATSQKKQRQIRRHSANFSGIKECEVIQWFVESGARIEEFEPICEVQSDKASVEITSRYSGVIKALHYEVGQMALVGKVSIAKHALFSLMS